jgi:hypothetical protein
MLSIVPRPPQLQGGRDKVLVGTNYQHLKNYSIQGVSFQTEERHISAGVKGG